MRVSINVLPTITISFNIKTTLTLTNAFGGALYFGRWIGGRRSHRHRWDILTFDAFTFCMLQ